MLAETDTASELAVEDGRSLRGKSSRWAILSMLSQGTKLVLLFGSQIVLARLLSPSDFGIVAMVTPLLSFLAIFNDLGLSQATIQRPALSHRESSMMFWINVALGTGIASLVVLIAPWTASLYHEPRLKLVMIALSGVVVINSLASQQCALMCRHMRAVQLAIIDIVPVVINVCVTAAAALLGASYWALVIGQAAHASTAACLAWILSDFRPSRPLREPAVWEMLSFGADITGYNVVSFLATNLNNIFVGALFGSLQVGLFDRGYKLVVMTSYQVLVPVSRIAESVLAKIPDDDVRYSRAFSQVLRALMVVILPGLLCLTTMPEIAVGLLYGEAWKGAGPAVRWFAAGTLLAPVGAAASWLMVSQGRTKVMLKAGLAKSLLSVISLLIGLPWGPLGVAVSFAVFAIPAQGVMVFSATRKGPVTLRGFTDAVSPIATAICGTSVLLWLAKASILVLVQQSYLQLAVGLAASYSLCVLMLGCSRAGRQILSDIAKLRSTFTRSVSPSKRPASAMAA